MLLNSLIAICSLCSSQILFEHLLCELKWKFSVVPNMQAPGSKDQPGRPTPRGVMSRPRMKPTADTLRICDPERINLHSSMNALLLQSVVLLLLHGYEGGRNALRFRIILYVWSSRASFMLLRTFFGSVYLNY